MVQLKSGLTLCLLFFLPLLLSGQPGKGQRFAAAGYLGSNLSQIDGDYYFGYNLPGIRFGLETQLLLNPKWYVSVGIGYSQLGSKPTRKEISERGGRSVALKLNMVEIPVLFNYRLGNKSAYTKKSNYGLYRSSILQLGLSLTRSTGYRISTEGTISALPRNQNFVSVEDRFENFDLYAIVGITVPVSIRTSLFVQHGKSIRGLYRPTELVREEVLPLFPYYLTFGVRHVVY